MHYRIDVRKFGFVNKIKRFDNPLKIRGLLDMSRPFVCSFEVKPGLSVLKYDPHGWLP